MSAAGFVAILCIALFGCFCIKKWKKPKKKAMNTPVDWSRSELPAFARTRDEDKNLREQLASLLDKRQDLEPAFALGAPVDGVHALAAGECWIRAVCRQNNVYAAALTAALCRLRPQGLPGDEAVFWQRSLLSLLGEGEGHFLLGLSCLRLYEAFRASDEAVALDAWRQAVEHFRRSAAIDHKDGMDAAYLLARIGHDVPFTPPAALPKPLPVNGEHGDRSPEVMYWRYRLAESGHIVAHVAHTLDVVKEVTVRLPLDDDMRSFWDEHMARHESLWEAGRARYAAAEERRERCYAQAGEKLAALRGQAEERLRRWAAAGHPDAAPAPRVKTPQAEPEKRRLAPGYLAPFVDPARQMLKSAPAGKGTCAITLTNETVMTARTPLFPLSALVFIPSSSSSRPPTSDAEAAFYLFIIIAGGLSILAALACALKRHWISMENPTFSKGTVKLPPFARPSHDALFVRGDGPERAQGGHAAGSKGIFPDAARESGEKTQGCRPGAAATPPPSWEEVCREQLDALLQTRPDLAFAMSLGELCDPTHAMDACLRIRRQLPSLSIPITAAVCRLLSQELPDGEADFWQTQTFFLLGEGEGCYRIGLSDLLLYIRFHQTHEDVALNAWRQAVEHFRRGGSAGHADCMEGAHLLAVIGHDVPFALPEDVQDPLPTPDPDDRRETESFYWCLRLAKAGDSGQALALARAYRRSRPVDRVHAEYWYHAALKGGNSLAGKELFQLYRDGEFTDETGRNSAVCLLVATLLSRKAEKLSARDMAQLEQEGGKRIGPQLAACKAEGEALARRFRTAAQKRNAARQRERDEIAAQIDAQIDARMDEINVNIQARRRFLAAEDLGAQLAETATRAKTSGRLRRNELQNSRPASSREDGPRRSFARPDKH